MTWREMSWRGKGQREGRRWEDHKAKNKNPKNNLKPTKFDFCALEPKSVSEKKLCDKCFILLQQRVAFPAIKYFGFPRWAQMCLTVLSPELCVVWPLSTTEEVVGASVFWFLQWNNLLQVLFKGGRQIY